MRKNIVASVLVAAVFVVPSITVAQQNTKTEASAVQKTVRKVSQPLRTAIGWTQRGVASFYKEPQKTAWGDRYNPWSNTMAHRTLPKGTMVKVTNHRTGKSTTLKVFDRGPYWDGRIADVSYKAAHDLGMVKNGIDKVTLKIVSVPKGASTERFVKAKGVQKPFEIQSVSAPASPVHSVNNMAMVHQVSSERGS